MSNGPVVNPGQVAVAGEPVAVVAYAEPEHFPLGIQCMLMLPGAVAPIGSLTLPAGCALAILPPGMSRALVAEFKRGLKAQQQAGTAKPNAPGLPT